uniref:Uncharacterized protein n=1 Tax=Amphimedon queenslandica TaxID=400682 RepID=A0A1X7TWL8_AMPQE
ICRLLVATLYHVPKGVRDLWADILFFTLRSVVDCPDDLDAWSCLPNGIFLLPSKFRVVSKAVMSFSPDSAPGPTGLSPNHHKEGIHCPSPSTATNFLLRLTQLTTHLAFGLLLQAIALHLCGASLLASCRKSGLCPIAIGEVFRRLASKCLVSLVSPQIHSIFHPHQVGVGCPNEAESIIHSVKLLVVMERVGKIRSLVSLLSSLEDAQSEFALLQSCLSLLKFLCALRTSPPNVPLPVCLQFDFLVCHAFSDVIGGSIPP